VKFGVYGVSGWLLIIGVLGLCDWTSLAPRPVTTKPVSHPAVSSAAPDQAKLGSMAPDFTLFADDGQVYRLSGLRGRKVLINFLCGCSRCTALGPDWERIHRGNPGAVVLGISTVLPSQLREFRRATGARFPILFDPAYRATEQYRAVECPRSWIVDQQGVLSYASRRDERLEQIRADLLRQFTTPPARGS
jgi:peroxiredoxin